MKIRYLELRNWLLLSFVGLLGFNACRSAKEPSVKPLPDDDRRVSQHGEIVLMYGVPTANYQIKGRVVGRGGEPVGGVQVLRIERNIEATPDAIVGDAERVEQYVRQNAVITDEQGRFTINSRSFPDDTLRLQIRDIDGEANGSYQSQLKKIPLQASDFKDASGWHRGDVDKDVTIQLEEK